jgi:hypothetical protein
LCACPGAAGETAVDAGLASGRRDKEHSDAVVFAATERAGEQHKPSSARLSMKVAWSFAAGCSKAPFPSVQLGPACDDILINIADGNPRHTPPSRTIARKKAGSSRADRLTPSRTTGPLKARDAAISSATLAPMLKPTTTSQALSTASWAASRA